jgi:hypothetical protein
MQISNAQARECITIIRIYLEKIIITFKKTQGIQPFIEDTFIAHQIGVTAKFNCREVQESIVYADFIFHIDNIDFGLNIDFQFNIVCDDNGHAELILSKALDLNEIEQHFIRLE